MPSYEAAYVPAETATVRRGVRTLLQALEMYSRLSTLPDCIYSCVYVINYQYCFNCLTCLTPCHTSSVLCFKSCEYEVHSVGTCESPAAGPASQLQSVRLGLFSQPGSEASLTQFTSAFIDPGCLKQALNQLSPH